MSIPLIIAIALAIPITLGAAAWIVRTGDEAEAHLPRSKRFAATVFTVALSAIFGVFAVGTFVWSGGITPLSAALMLFFCGFGMGPTFSAVEQARPSASARIVKIHHLAQGLCYVFSGVCYAVASMAHGWWLALAGFGVGWIGIIRLYMATGRELRA